MTEPHGDVISVPEDIGVKDRHAGDVVGLLWLAFICAASVAYLMWLDGAIGGAS